MTVAHGEPVTSTTDVEPPVPGLLDRRSLNLPNAITVSRLVLALVLFALIDIEGWWRTSAAVFCFAAATDFLDGWVARRYGLITILGRVMDPFVDKVIICGSFLFLIAKEGSGVGPWVAFVIFAREMFVTSLRAVLEKEGRDFSAAWSGKIKMALQCAAVTACLLSLSPELAADFGGWWETFLVLRDWIVIATVVITVYSGLVYVVRAAMMLRTP